ncbi:hypothetical protein [Croceimicrobium hydrocarbonivorans]|uniref:Uncharacterized protein n=1 Tax=Croceimicrobium hydrocarbonivorans TaxID=2761580 RepID=A0A7H0VG19_9FLAO|nr:hypothetical protein [Croceimicrobium hydrocarbonivorans]QNR24667.1 hypothetical protein H4K34_02150 [Croceimicrobium hydrocarbonivorans]
MFERLKIKRWIATFTFIVLPLIKLSAQSKSFHFKRNNTEWIVFADSKKLGVGLPTSRINVLEERTVISSDSLIRRYLEHRFRDGELPQQGGGNCPVILDSWDDYYRQVVFYYDEEKSEDCILFHYVHKSVIVNHPNWKERWVFISGGCSNYWMARISLKSREVFSFGIN